jgi:hypothetical protein
MPRSWSIVMVLMVASALFAMVTVDLEGSSVCSRPSSLGFVITQQDSLVRARVWTLTLCLQQVELTTAAAPKYVYVAKPIASEHKMVHAAESATASFANQDVSRAVLKAQQTAKKEYEAMMASALQVRAMCPLIWLLVCRESLGPDCDAPVDVRI